MMWEVVAATRWGRRLTVSEQAPCRHRARRWPRHGRRHRDQRCPHTTRIARDLVDAHVQMLLAMERPFTTKLEKSGPRPAVRDHLSVALVCPRTTRLPRQLGSTSNDPNVKVGRHQNYRLVVALHGQAGLHCLGLEYFVSRADERWNTPE